MFPENGRQPVESAASGSRARVPGYYDVLADAEAAACGQDLYPWLSASAEATRLVWLCMALARTLEQAEALLRGEPVHPGALDQRMLRHARSTGAL